MNNDLERKIVYEDDEVIAYADDLVGHINYDNPVNLYIINKKGIESFDSTLTLNKLDN